MDSDCPALFPKCRGRKILDPLNLFVDLTGGASETATCAAALAAFPAFAADLAALSANETAAGDVLITSSQTFQLPVDGGTFGVGLRVVDLASLRMNSGSKLQLNGGVTTNVVVIRVTGLFSTVSAEIILSGLTPEQVLFVSAAGASMSFTKFRGTVVSPMDPVIFAGGTTTTLEGAILARNMTVGVNVQVIHRPWSGMIP